MSHNRAFAGPLAVNGGAKYIKTSTGYGPGVATIEDVKLLKEFAGGRINVKAAGGITELDTALELIEAGTDRIGTSSGIKMVAELKERLFPTKKEEDPRPVIDPL